MVRSSSSTSSSSSSSLLLPTLLVVASASSGALLTWWWQQYVNRNRRGFYVDCDDDDAAVPQPRKRIYLDYNGTTPVDRRVVQAMGPFLFQHYGNPNSSHWAGKVPKQAIDQARRQILKLLLQKNAEHDEPVSKENAVVIPDTLLPSICFTSCGTESNNMAIYLALLQYNNNKKDSLPHVITSNIEHAAILACLQRLEAEHRCTVTFVPTQPDGRVRAVDVIAAITDQTVLVTLMLANNETGALQPIREVAEHCRARSILVHTDAAQAVGKVSVALTDLGDPDMISIVGHKIGGPKGIACLYIRPGCLKSNTTTLSVASNAGILLIGAGQEQGMRSGTQNVPGIVAMGKAAELVAAEWPTNAKHMEDLRRRMLINLSKGAASAFLQVRVNGPSHPSLRLPNTLSVGIEGIDSGKLLQTIGHQVGASSGATCHSGCASTISSVLTAMNVPIEYARGTLRLSVGPKTTVADIDEACTIIMQAAKLQPKS